VSIDIAVRPWADLVFHVLAHVPSATPASLFDPVYAAFAARYLGPVEERPLAEDVRTLAALATEHARFAKLQALAWLFSGVGDDERVRDRELGSLGSSDVADETLLAALRGMGPAVEVLRCAAQLEAEAHARLPPVAIDAPALTEALERVGRAAPTLPGFRIGVVRSLRLRGRVRQREIWVGAPSAEPGPGLAHSAWQAAHEATVAELIGALGASRVVEREVEHTALVVLAERASRAGLASEHGAWFAHFGLSREALELDALSGPLRHTVRAFLAT
jgi:hypothetical protein